MGFGEFLASSGLGFRTAFLLSMVLLFPHTFSWFLFSCGLCCSISSVVSQRLLSTCWFSLISCTTIYLHVPTAFKDESML